MNALRKVLTKGIILFKRVLSEEESQEIEESTRQRSTIQREYSSRLNFTKSKESTR